MNFSLFLILLGVIRLIFCTRGNNTGDDSGNVCLSLFRRKRANAEYTRWHANPETKQEFIVKVLEDDTISTSETKHIAAINIQPITKAQEKIIVRGVQVANKDSALDGILNEYTRFVPPTTLSVTRLTVNPIPEEITPVRPPGISKPQLTNIDKMAFRSQGAGFKYGHDRNSQHDNYSPPVSRQYAPITPVSFTQRKTPRVIDQFMLVKTTIRPTRTSPFLVISPARTSELVNFLSFNKKPFSRSTLTSIVRTAFMDEVKSDEEISRKSNLDVSINSNSIIDKVSDATYNDLFYNDGDRSERTTRKMQQSFMDNNDLDNGLIATENYIDLIESKKDKKPQSYDANYEDQDYGGISTVSREDENNSVTITKGKISKTIENEHYKRKLGCTVLKLRSLSFSSPLTLHEIVAQLKQWAGESPVAKWVDITKGNFTIMENPIYMMLVDDLSSGQIVSAKKTVMIVAGIQGRDHHAVTAAMYVLYKLIERSEAHADLLSKYRFWIIPVFNPDGYDYSLTFPHRRQWPKNLRQTWDSCKGRDSCAACEEFGIRCTIQPCYGVNLDRNFEYQWIPTEELKMEHPCGNLYAGPRQLSEAETSALTHFLHEQRTPLYAFIAFKEGDVLGVMYPYSHTRKKRAFDHVFRQRASQAASAAYSISGRPYVAGQTSEFLPLYAGGIEDWVDGHLGIDNTYTIMMFRPTDAQNSKLVTERVVHEAYAAVDTLLLHNVQVPFGPPAVTLTRACGWLLIPPSTSFVFILTLIVAGYG